MARNKDLPSKLRRAKSMNQTRSVPNWVVRRTGGKLEQALLLEENGEILD